MHSRFENVRIANRDRPSVYAPTFKVGRCTPPTYRPPQARLSSSRTVVNAKRQTSTVNDATVKSLDLSLSLSLSHRLPVVYTSVTYSLAISSNATSMSIHPWISSQGPGCCHTATVRASCTQLLYIDAHVIVVALVIDPRRASLTGTGIAMI